MRPSKERLTEIRSVKHISLSWPGEMIRDLLAEIDALEAENKKQSYLIDMGAKDLQTIQQLLSERDQLKDRVKELEDQLKK